MVRKVTDQSTVEQIDGPMRAIKLRRQKLPTVDLYDNPFAQDRQLEDQSRMITTNQNPRFFENTKVDRVRSQLTVKKAPSRALAIKAKVLNKIVREASGVHTYAMVPPPIQVTGPDLDIDDDPDSNTYVHEYAKESKQKPVICSFGHRPKSASRTFNPATMKFRLRHGEIVKSTSPHKSGFGLPLTILKKVMKAPRLKYPNEIDDEEPTKIGEESSFRTNYNDVVGDNPADPYNLFGNPEGYEGSIVGNSGGSDNGGTAAGGDDGENDNSNINNSSSNLRKGSSLRGGVGFSDQTLRKDDSTWVSMSNLHDKSLAQSGDVNDVSQITTEKRNYNKKKKKKLPLREILPPIWPMKQDISQREPWNEKHHQKDPKQATIEFFKLKSSGLSEVEAMPLKERLTRFNERAGPGDRSMFCIEKQVTDIEVLHGTAKSPGKAKPIKGHHLYFDPLNSNLQERIREHAVVVEKEKVYWDRKAKQDAWKTVEKCDYDPLKELEKMKAKTRHMLENLDLNKANSRGNTADNNYNSNSSRGNTAQESESFNDGGFELIHEGDGGGEEEEFEEEEDRDGDGEEEADV